MVVGKLLSFFQGLLVSYVRFREANIFVIKSSEKIDIGMGSHHPFLFVEFGNLENIEILIDQSPQKNVK